MTLLSKNGNQPGTSSPVLPEREPSHQPVVSGVVTGTAHVPPNTMEAESSRAAELRRPSVTVQPQARVRRPFFENLAAQAMEELMVMAHAGEPLWTRGLDGYSEILNEEEYARAFPRGIGPKLPSLRSEVTRVTGLIFSTPLYIVEIIMSMVGER